MIFYAMCKETTENKKAPHLRGFSITKKGTSGLLQLSDQCFLLQIGTSSYTFRQVN